MKFNHISEFKGSFPQRITARTPEDRLDWIKCIQLSSYSYLNRQIEYLADQVKAASMGNRIERGAPLAPPQEETSAKKEEGDLIQF